MVLRAQQAFQFGDSAAQERIVAELRRASDFTLGGAPMVQMLRQPRRKRSAGAADDRAGALVGRANERPRPARSPRSHAGALEGSKGGARGCRKSSIRTSPSNTARSSPRLRFSRYRLRSSRSFATRSLAGARPAPPAKKATEHGLSPHDDIYPQLRSYLLGILSIRLGDRDAALRSAAELERPIESPKVSANLSRLRRKLARTGGAARRKTSRSARHSRADSARDRLGGDVPIGILLPAYERYLRAEMLRAVGREQEALPWYTSLEESMLYDRVYLAPSHLRRAEIYEKLGDREKAIFHYSRFLELWKDCDDAFKPQLAEAEKRLERLKGQA